MYTFTLTKDGQVIEHVEGLTLREAGDKVMRGFYYLDMGTEWERHVRYMLSILQVGAKNWDKAQDYDKSFEVVRTS